MEDVETYLRDYRLGHGHKAPMSVFGEWWAVQDLNL